MSKSEPVKDGFYSKIFVSAIVVIWVSLVGGNWLGHYVVEKEWLNKGKSSKSEYKSTINQKPKPWVTVDSRQVEAVEQMTGQKNGFPGTTSSPAESATPDGSFNPQEIITSTPMAVPENSPTPLKASPKASPKAPKDTPAPAPSALTMEPPSTQPPPPTPLADQKFQLQFGSFSTLENAKSMVDELAQKGQPAQVEEIPTGHTKVYRVRGGSYSEEEARLQRDKLREMQIEAYIVK